MKKCLTVALISLALAACQNTSFVFSKVVPAKPSYTATMHYTFWDKRASIDAVAICGSAENVAMVEEKEQTGQSWVRALTSAIYQPVTVSVYCKRPVKTNYKAQQPK